MPVVTLPDGSHRSFSESVTVHDVAADIGAGLAKAALAGRVNGKLVDTSYPIEDDAELAIITERDEEGVDVIRHSTAHLMAMAVKGGRSLARGDFQALQVQLGVWMERR